MALIVCFMVGTVVLAVFGEQLGWGWWWTLPLGLGFVLVILAFRLLVQRIAERGRQIDEQLDALERARPGHPTEPELGPRA